MSRFSEYATSTAFEVRLSKAQIGALNTFVLPDNSMLRLKFGFNEQTLRALWDKGLLDRDDENRYVLSAAGSATVSMLKLAGLIEYSRKQLITDAELQSMLGESE